MKIDITLLKKYLNKSPRFTLDQFCQHTCVSKRFEEIKAIYYIDTSVLLENLPLVKFIKLHPGPEWFIFHNLTREFIDDVISVISLYYVIDVFLSI